MKRLLDTAVAVLLPVVALVVLVLAGRGAFRGAATFPPIFAGVVAVLGIVWLLSPSRRAVRWQAALVVLGVGVGLGGVGVHFRYLEEQRRAAEEAGMAALAAGPAPEIPYSQAFHQDPDAESPFGLAGSWTLVNFWATWCSPCREEMPVLERFWREHRAEGLRVVGVTRIWGGGDVASIAAERAEIEAFLAEAGVSYPVLVSDAATVEAYRVKSWPSTILVGPDGRAVAYGVGIEGAEELMARAERLLASG